MKQKRRDKPNLEKERFIKTQKKDAENVLAGKQNVETTSIEEDATGKKRKEKRRLLSWRTM